MECTVNTAYQTLSPPQLPLWAVSAVNINPKNGDDSNWWLRGEASFHGPKDDRLQALWFI